MATTDRNKTIIHYYPGFKGIRLSDGELAGRALMDSIDKKYNVQKVIPSWWNKVLGL